MWACLSLLASVVEDRVWYVKHTGKKLLPNLYIFLVGPGSLGKGCSIDGVVDLCDAANVSINKIRGKLTYKGLIDEMAEQKFTDPNTGRIYTPKSRLWILMDELKADLGSSRNLVEDFISTMTELYTGYYEASDRTRLHGKIITDRACLNWLTGSTKSWLMKCFSLDDVYSGATARIAFVFADYSRQLRYVRPILPEDSEEVMKYLVARVKMLPYLQGQVIMTDDAWTLENQWYYNRKSPMDDAMWPAWKRGQDLALKLAMLNVIADGGPLVINYNQMHRAIKLVDMSLRHMRTLLALASKTPEISNVNKVANVIMKKGRVTHQALGKYMWNRGLRAKELREAIMELMGRDLVEMDVVQGREGFRKQPTYVWIGGEEGGMR